MATSSSPSTPRQGEGPVKTKALSLSFVVSSVGLASVVILSGCSANFGDVSSAPTGTAMHIKGAVHGGQQPLNGAHVYMYAANTGAYGGSGIAASSSNASTSLLTAATGNPADGNGNFYVVTDAGGNFDIHGAFACTPNTQVYLYSIGGDPQLSGQGVAGTPNSAAALMAVVGDCASATPSGAFPNVTFVSLNEVSTVATAYALAGFTTDPLHIGAPSASGDALAGTGLANAFTIGLNLVNQSTGLPNPTLPLNSNAVVPVTTINTVADILAACVNSSGAGSSGCSTLFSNTTYATMPTDTAAAAINIAQNAGTNINFLLPLANNTSPFQPFNSTIIDLSLGINYTGGGLTSPNGIAVDASGNAWVANAGGFDVTEISSAGSYLSGASGYQDISLVGPSNIAIDRANNVWVTSGGIGLIELSNAGTVFNGTVGSRGGALDEPESIAIDGAGNLWASDFRNSVSKLSSTGAILPGDVYTGGGLSEPNGMAIDGAGNAWAGNFSGASVTEFSNTGTVLSGTNGYTGGGLQTPQQIAIDGAGNAWIAGGGFAVTEISNTGTFLSGTTGYVADNTVNEAAGIAIDGAGNAWVANTFGSVVGISSTGATLSGFSGYANGGLNQPMQIAIDGSGNAWITNFQGNSVTEMIGVGVPVITPIAAGLPAIPTKDGSSNLGTRP
jgi:hypothetical protein